MNYLKISRADYISDKNLSQIFQENVLRHSFWYNSRTKLSWNILYP